MEWSSGEEFVCEVVRIEKVVNLGRERGREVGVGGVYGLIVD